MKNMKIFTIAIFTFLSINLFAQTKEESIKKIEEINKNANFQQGAIKSIEEIAQN
jgi:hypothetical protein